MTLAVAVISSTPAESGRRRGGRRPKLTPEQQAEVIENVLSGRQSAARMARFFRVSEATISRLVSAARRAREAQQG